MSVILSSKDSSILQHFVSMHLFELLHVLSVGAPTYAQKSTVLFATLAQMAVLRWTLLFNSSDCSVHRWLCRDVDKQWRRTSPCLPVVTRAKPTVVEVPPHH